MARLVRASVLLGDRLCTPPSPPHGPGEASSVSPCFKGRSWWTLYVSGRSLSRVGDMVLVIFLFLLLTYPCLALVLDSHSRVGETALEAFFVLPIVCTLLHCSLCTHEGRYFVLIKPWVLPYPKCAQKRSRVGDISPIMPNLDQSRSWPFADRFSIYLESCVCDDGLLALMSQGLVVFVGICELNLWYAATPALFIEYNILLHHY